MSVTLLEPEPVVGDSNLKLVAGPITPSPFTARAEDVMQGAIAACPLAAVMVALARARPSNLHRMLGAPQRATVLSKRSASKSFDLKSGFYYDVVFPGRGTATRISPLVYVAGDIVRYARTPSGAGWPSYIEKAYAVWKSGGGRSGSGGTYTPLAFSTSKPGPRELGTVMGDLIGEFDVLDHARKLFIAPSGVARTMGAGDIAAMARRSPRRPTAAPTFPRLAGKARVRADHTYAVIGYRKGVTLRDPWGGAGATMTVSVAEFEESFHGIWQAV